MKFYRVVKDGVHDYFTGNTTVINELVTEKERNTKFRYISDFAFEVVDVSKKNTYWSFGARFEIGTGATYDKTGRFILCDGVKLYTA